MNRKAHNEQIWSAVPPIADVGGVFKEFSDGPLTVISSSGDPGKLDTRDSESSTCAEVNFVLNHSAYPPALAKRLRNFDCAKNDAWPGPIIQVGNNVRLKPTFEIWREPPQLEIKQLLQARQRPQRVLLFVCFKNQSDRQGDHARDSSTPPFGVRNGSNCEETHIEKI
jgi:hypothetical protein